MACHTVLYVWTDGASYERRAKKVQGGGAEAEALQFLSNASRYVVAGSDAACA